MCFWNFEAVLYDRFVVLLADNGYVRAGLDDSDAGEGLRISRGEIPNSGSP